MKALPHVSARPCWDSMDKQICKQLIPTMINFITLPLTGAIDNIFIGTLANPLANAGQLAADQVFMTSGVFTEALPAATRPFVAQAHARGNTSEVQLTSGAAMSVSLATGSLVSLLLARGSEFWLLALGSKAALQFSAPYLAYRLPGVIPAIMSAVGFSTLQGVKDSVTPMKISVASLALNALLNYLLMFPAGLGIVGAAIATAASQIVAGIVYAFILLRRKLIYWSAVFSLPSREMLSKFAPAVGALLLSAIARQSVFASITKVVQGLDSTGVAAAAHSITLTFWQLGGILLYAMQNVATTLMAGELGAKESTPESARATAKRLLAWGSLLGFAMAAMQIIGLPFLQVFHPIKDVQIAARVPSIIGAVLQVINGFLFVGEGIMLASGGVGLLAIGRVIAAVGTILALGVVPRTLVGVWSCFWVYIFGRLSTFVWFWFANSPVQKGQNRQPKPAL